MRIVALHLPGQTKTRIIPLWHAASSYYTSHIGAHIVPRRPIRLHYITALHSSIYGVICGCKRVRDNALFARVARARTHIRKHAWIVRASVAHAKGWAGGWQDERMKNKLKRCLLVKTRQCALNNKLLSGRLGRIASDSVRIINIVHVYITCDDDNPYRVVYILHSFALICWHIFDALDLIHP